MQLLASGLRRLGHQALAVSYRPPSIYSRSLDVCLAVNGGRRGYRELPRLFRFTLGAARQFDVFHFFFGRSLLPRNLDLFFLRLLGKRVVGHFHGSDVRQQKYLCHVVERKLANQCVSISSPVSSNRQQRLIKRWQRYADLTLVSIPELLSVVPSGVLFPPAIELLKWPFCPERSTDANGPWIIGHATTNRRCKGTWYVIQAVEQLRDEGYDVSLRLMERVPHEQISEHYAGCHVGVDELVQGCYGVVSMELMAMGKPVVANLMPWYRTHRPDLPIQHAVPQTLKSSLKELLEDQAKRIQLGHRGREYVRRHHNIDVAVSELVSLYCKHLQIGR
jgi:hypothetical protein